VLTHIHPSTRWFASTGAPLFTGPICPGTPEAAKCPESLCMIEVLPRSSWSRGTTSAGVTPPSSLLRTHAPVLNPPRASVRPSDTRSVQVAVSPCWEEDLPDVISAHPSLRAWTPTPAALEVRLPVSSPKTSAFPSFGPGRRSTKPVQRFQYGAHFEAAVILLCSGPQVCSPPRSLLPIRPRRMAAVTFPSEPLVGCYLPTPRICLPSESGN
jgi:hypothetical protein